MNNNAALEHEALDRVDRHAHWLLRFSLTSVFLYMGIDKFMGGGIAEFSQTMELPLFLSTLVALTEIAAGVLIVAGAVLSPWITRLGALMTVPVLLGAIFMVHWGQWHFMATPTHPLGGMMFQITLLMVALYMLIRGDKM